MDENGKRRARNQEIEIFHLQLSTLSRDGKKIIPDLPDLPDLKIPKHKVIETGNGTLLRNGKWWASYETKQDIRRIVYARELYLNGILCLKW